MRNSFKAGDRIVVDDPSYVGIDGRRVSQGDNHGRCGRIVQVTGTIINGQRLYRVRFDEDDIGLFWTNELQAG